MKGPRKMHLKQTVSPFTLDYDLWAALEEFRERTGKSRSRLLEKAVRLLLEAEGVMPGRGGRIEAIGGGPAAIEEARAKAAEEKRLKEEAAKAEAARKEKEEIFRIRKAWNDNFRVRGEVPKNGFAAENEEEEEAERRALEAEKAAREAFV